MPGTPGRRAHPDGGYQPPRRFACDGLPPRTTRESDPASRQELLHFRAIVSDSRGKWVGVSETGSDRTGISERACPWCGSPATTFVSRGYTGPTDETDQYFTCQSCGRTTFELVAKSAREMRLGRYKPGDVYQDRANRTRYQISRVLRVGSNEYLIYLKPLSVEPAAKAGGRSAKPVPATSGDEA